jgi:hypothetical protein
MHQYLADDLEKYLRAALSIRQLADSEAMKQFFGKEINDQSLAKKKVWPPLKGVGGVKEAMLSSAEGSQKLFAVAWATTGINKKRSSQQIRKEKPCDLPLKETLRDEVPTPEEDTLYSPVLRESSTFTRSGSLSDGTLQRSSTSCSLNGYSFIRDGKMNFFKHPRIVPSRRSRT